MLVRGETNVSILSALLQLVEHPVKGGATSSTAEKFIQPHSFANLSSSDSCAGGGRRYSKVSGRDRGIPLPIDTATCTGPGACGGTVARSTPGCSTIAGTCVGDKQMLT